MCEKRKATVSPGVCAHACVECDGPWRVELREAIKRGLPQGPPPPPEPSWTEMGVNLASSLAVWAKAGFPVASVEEVTHRRVVCLSCDRWDPEARAGLGKCMECGCCSVKWWLATATCKLEKWRR